MSAHDSRRLPELWLKRADQVLVASVLGVGLAVLVCYGIIHQRRHGAWIDIERAAPLPLELQIDINRADWPELTLLPGISETYARRIVESRQREGPFHGPEDLQRVSGIGPRTMEQIRPYLAPLAPPADLAGPR